MSNEPNDTRRGGQPVNGQPAPHPQMSETDRMARLASDTYVEKVAENAADKTVEYATTSDQEPQQRIDQAKEEARGLWTKYCGCLGST
ncbi:hypothetical protein PM082_009054 [Marasmius tenuissimus]|nr:hypothetical protein PM082_009054 [Marasmius tenuissimus]